MSAVGGSIISVTLGGREFAVSADSDINRKLGGFENDVQANGDGSARIIKTRVPASFSGLTAVVDDARGDHEFLQDFADDPAYKPCTVTFASGDTYGGEMTITGEMQYSSSSATASIDLMGPGRLTKI